MAEIYYRCGSCGDLWLTHDDAIHCCVEPPVPVGEDEVEPCPDCSGTGWTDGMLECDACHGVGMLPKGGP